MIEENSDRKIAVIFATDVVDIASLLRIMKNRHSRTLKNVGIYLIT